jgi:hypothetical protein
MPDADAALVAELMTEADVWGGEATASSACRTTSAASWRGRRQPQAGIRVTQERRRPRSSTATTRWAIS